MVVASAEALAIAAYSRDLGLDLAVEMHCDSAAALGITNRAGIDKVRHLRTLSGWVQVLWFQEVRVSGRTAYRKVLGEKSPANLLTKYLAAEVIHQHCDTLNMRWVEGRAETAPTLDSVESYCQSWVEDCEYVDEGGQKENESINAVQEDRSGRGRRVHSADIVTVRPIPATAKGQAAASTRQERG